MSYIRTKDGVYEVDNNTKGTEDFLWVKTSKANIIQCVWLNCIINQSENLEELVDNTVYYIDGLFGEERKITWYGVIYTEKGIITVAKTNDNGELELI